MNIILPFEQGANPTIEGDEKLVTFNYFFTRKLTFVKEAVAAHDFAKKMREADWMSITGAGSGIMGAANEGAGAHHHLRPENHPPSRPGVKPAHPRL